MAANAGVASTLAAIRIAAQIVFRMMQNSEIGLHPRGKLKTGQLQPEPGGRWVSERGLRVATGETTLARFAALKVGVFPELDDIIPADGSLLLVFRRGQRASAGLLQALQMPLTNHEATAAGTLHEIPVQYGGEAGPDLPLLAQQAGLGEADYIGAHAAGEYTVAFLGFQPGFPYLRGLPARLHAPRRATPRVSVPAGSVAIGGTYAGIYPANGPGGWQVIGRTAVKLFDPLREAPALLLPGDRVRFLPQ
jgi:KipI family sensor histidine kinase inhibitor